MTLSYVIEALRELSFAIQRQVLPGVPLRERGGVA